MSTTNYDLVVIGGGSGGVASSRRSAALGAKVALIEDDRLGGTCVIRGCVPKKLMMFASQFGATLKTGLQPGWRIQEATFDMATWQEAKTKEIDRLEGIYQRMLSNSGVEVISGRGEIVSPNQVRVGDLLINTKRILIATGGRPRTNAFPGSELAATSNEVLDLTELPKRAGILGAGYIALEFACILAGLGVQVDVFFRGNMPLRGFDADIQRRLTEALINQGIRLHPESSFQSLSRENSTYTLYTSGAEYSFDFVLNALGRVPNTQGLGLESIGLETDAAGAIPVNEYSQTKVAGVFAVGDVTNRVNLTPVAIAEGRALAENEFNGGDVTINHSLVATATFTNPPIGTVGLTESQAASRFVTRVYETEFTPMKIGFSGGKQRIYMKLLVNDSTNIVVGAHMLGEDSPEMIQPLGVAIQAKATKQDFDKTIAVHPTSAEEWVLLRETTRTVGG